MNITTPVRRMDEAELDQRWDAIERSSGRAPGDQALGKLIAEAAASGWTVREIAAHKGVSPSHVSRLLIFGRFLGLSPVGDKFGKLTEGAFRDRWSETNENRDERKRFEEVAHQLGIDLAPAPELPPAPPPPPPTNIKALEDEIMQKHGFAPDSSRIYEIRAILKEGHPNVVEKVRQGVVKVHSALSFVRNADGKRQATASADDIQSMGNLWHAESHGRIKPRSRKPTKKPSKKPLVELSAEEKEANRRRLIEEDFRRQQEARERRTQRKDMTADDKPVVMYGVRLWPVDEKERLIVGYYDYDQMFYAVHLFRDWLNVVSIGVKNNDSRAAYMRERMKALIVFAKRRLSGDCQKEVLQICALFQKLADFMRDNPEGECRHPPDIDMVLDGF
jgi:transcriptional regulator with XRE-family HTH domain